MKNLFTIYGTIGRRDYFRYLLILYAVLAFSGLFYILFVDAVASQAEVNTLMQYLILVLSIALILIYLTISVLSLFLLIRRARQTSSMALWIVIGLLIPFGFIFVGLIPSKTP